MGVIVGRGDEMLHWWENKGREKRSFYMEAYER